MTYVVKEIFFTLQGEGRQAGRPAVFCRFAGCNLWTGREQDRRTAVCRFCDTDFVGTDGVGGGKFGDADDLADAIAATWPPSDDSDGRRYVVCTGGEPTLQLDDPLVAALHRRDFEIAVESNGTLPMLAGVDWICISPKAGTELAQTTGDELKLVFPQEGARPERFLHLDFRHFLLQPMDGPDREANTAAALAYCLAHPRWSLSLQSQKFLGIP
jgi:7-carboxy-7-deazaguanine synthase (Cx14CxxC type)